MSGTDATMLLGTKIQTNETQCLLTDKKKKEKEINKIKEEGRKRKSRKAIFLIRLLLLPLKKIKKKKKICGALETAGPNLRTSVKSA